MRSMVLLLRSSWIFFHMLASSTVVKTDFSCGYIDGCVKASAQ
uniref:Uncharacterized protein n=1 Tax=Setaria viridis TaxID=4556 RepID=A0A4U6TNJ5_SETVI|nr:hypothetical protein SEVIR_7G024705v2 [Setaria viridis]